MRAIFLAVSLALIVPACGDDGDPPVVAGDDVTTTSTSTTTAERSSDGPPPIGITGGEHDLTLEAWSYCWSSDTGGVCADGAPPDPLPDAGAADELLVHFDGAPDGDWTFEVVFDGQACGGETAELERVDETTFRLVPLGRPGDHEVHLYGRGAADLATSFRWTTTIEGAYTQPRSTTSIVADHDGVMDSYGVELSASHLAAPVIDASGTVTVTSASGAAHVIELRRVDDGCTDTPNVRFDAPAEEGVAAAKLPGGAPFTYEATLILDGSTHVGRAVWPDDVDEECSPCVPLTFDPPLPARGPAAG